MSNILIIKHGSLGDISQACGAIQDISENHNNDEIYLMTTKPYIDLFKKNTSIKEVILDKRLSRFNVFYLYTLMRKLKKLKLSKVYDLQNSSRTNFYKKILFPNSDCHTWSSSITTLPSDNSKKDFDKKPVLDRFDHQLKTSGVNTKNTLLPNFTWSCDNINDVIEEFNIKKYILLFPFCSPHLKSKKWPYYNELIDMIKSKYKDDYKILIAPGPDEINQSKEINANCILKNGRALNIPELSSLIKKHDWAQYFVTLGHNVCKIVVKSLAK